VEVVQVRVVPLYEPLLPQAPQQRWIHLFLFRQRQKNQIKKEGPLEPAYLVNGRPTR
jgi:hypothetical protein